MPSRVLFATVLSLVVTGAAVAQDNKISFKATEVAPGLHMLEGVGGFAGGNIGVLTGSDGVVLIDDSIEPLSATLLEAIRQVTGDPVDFVINTHVHGDHIGGNEVMGKAGATIVAHENIRRRLVENGIQGADGMVPAPPDALPELTFSDSVTFHLNGHEAYVFHVAHAHTDGDAVIHFRNSNVIHTGDVLFNGLFPYIDLDSGGSVGGYIAAMERVIAVADADTKIIAGHGPMATKGDVEKARDMLIDARDRVKQRIAAGASEDEVVAAAPLASYDADWSWGFINAEQMTRTLYRDLASE